VDRQYFDKLISRFPVVSAGFGVSRNLEKNRIPELTLQDRFPEKAHRSPHVSGFPPPAVSGGCHVGKPVEADA